MALLKAGLCPSLTSEIVTQLSKQGIKRVLDYICIDPEKITGLCEVSYKTVVAIRRVLLAQYSSFPINGANLYEESLAMLSILPTPSTALNDALESGIFTGEVTEIKGPSCSGKTQFCLSVAVNIVDLLSKNVIIIDTANGFSIDRIESIVRKRFNNMSKFTESLSRIRLCKCSSAYQLMDILTMIRANLDAHNDSYFASLKAIIIDSVSAVSSPLMQSVSYVEGQSFLTTLKRELNALSKVYTLAVVVTTEFNPKGNFLSSKHPLGLSWSTAACTEIYLEGPLYLKEIGSNCEKKKVESCGNAAVIKSFHGGGTGNIAFTFTDDGIA